MEQVNLEDDSKLTEEEPLTSDSLPNTSANEAAAASDGSNTAETAATNTEPAPQSADLDDGEDLFASTSDDVVVKKEKVPEPASFSFSPSSSEASTKPLTSDKDEDLAAEAEDQFNIEVQVTSPTKIGDGMNAYMVYHVKTLTNVPVYKKSEFDVKRRFSDFLGLHNKLVAKHQCNGIIVPKAPEKSAMGMAKVKMSKEESGSHDFVEKRRAALERYMNHTVSHPTLRMDPDMRDFLTLDADLPKASSTSALSAAGVMRLFGKVGDAVTKMSSNLQEPDSWFEDKIQLIENLEIQIRKLHEYSEVLVSRRHAAAQNVSSLAKALAVVATEDEHTVLKQVMSKLSTVEESIQQIYEEQADSDFFTFSELLKDYLSLISAVKDVFGERIKIHKHWKDAEATLTKKREAKVKLELAANKQDKVAQATADCEEWEKKVTQGEADFDRISKELKKEMERFDRKRVRDFKANLINYLEKLLSNEEQLLQHWEAFLPEAKSIA